MDLAGKITLDTAKELAMIENNEIGRQIRRYFIRCEKQIKMVDVPALAIPSLRNRKGQTAWLTYQELVAMALHEKAPLSILLNALQSQGFNIEAARLEYNGWKHTSEAYHNRLTRIADDIAATVKTGLRVTQY